MATVYEMLKDVGNRKEGYSEDSVEYREWVQIEANLLVAEAMTNLGGDLRHFGEIIVMLKHEISEKK